MEEPKTPECDKLAKIADKSQSCGLFIDWLHSRGYILAQWHTHKKECYGDPTHKHWLTCGITEGQPIAASYDLQKLLGEFFEIDPAKVEEEKRAILEFLRAQREGEKA